MSAAPIRDQLPQLFLEYEMDCMDRDKIMETTRRLCGIRETATSGLYKDIGDETYGSFNSDEMARQLVRIIESAISLPTLEETKSEARKALRLIKTGELEETTNYVVNSKTIIKCLEECLGEEDIASCKRCLLKALNVLKHGTTDADTYEPEP